MKFLEYTPLDSINDFLSYVSLGECAIKGSLEAYSCKHTGTDRKLSLSLEHEILDYLGRSADSDPPSPVESLSSRSSRKTLIYLVLTLSHLYPDYDFSAVQAHQFFREEVWDSVKQIFDTYMFEAAKEWAKVNGGTPLLESLYKALDEAVKLGECEIYSYNPEDGDPLLERGAMWSFNFFFYNRKLKRVVSFRCCCLSNLAAEGFLTDGLRDEEDGSLPVQTPTEHLSILDKERGKYEILIQAVDDVRPSHYDAHICQICRHLLDLFFGCGSLDLKKMDVTLWNAVCLLIQALFVVYFYI